MRDLENRINFDQTCRVCLAKENNMKSLFSVEQILENEIKLSDMLMSCSSIRIEKNEGLPEKICCRCSEQANIAYLFRKLCESSDSTLRELSKQFDIQRNLFSEGDKENANPENSERHNVSSRNNEIDSEIYNEENLNQDLEKSFPTVNENGDQENSFEEVVLKQTSSGIKESYICSSNRLSFEKVNIKKTNLPTSCDICNKSFRFHSNLERHKLVHSGEKPYLCNVCGKGFAQSSALKIHNFIHTGEKPYKCQICLQSFGAPSTLMTHLRTHTGERPHVCKICGKHFPQAGYLSSHIRTHTGEKLVECRICGQKFNQSGKLTIHMRIHSGEKPYQCGTCKRCFSEKGTLKKHIRIHTGERPYSCKICGQTFAQNGTLATHLKIHKTKLNE